MSNGVNAPRNRSMVIYLKTSWFTVVSGGERLPHPQEVDKILMDQPVEPVTCGFLLRKIDHNFQCLTRQQYFRPANRVGKWRADYNMRVRCPSSGITWRIIPLDVSSDRITPIYWRHEVNGHL